MFGKMALQQEKCFLKCGYHCNMLPEYWCCGQDVCRLVFGELGVVARHSDTRGLSIYTGGIEFNMTA
jgi:hypothetical protein